VQIDSVQVTDDLAATFPGVAFSAASLTSPTLTVNPAFNGAGDTALLAGTDVLAAGATATLSFSLTFNPGANTGPFLNSATAAGTSPAATPVGDVSDDGADPDPNGNGDPTEAGENDPTPIAYVESPVLGVAKAAGTTADNGDGTFTVALSFVLENLGNVQIDGVQVTDDLAAAFPGVAFSVASLTSPTLTVNPAFNGAGDTALLDGTDVLAAGATATISFSLTFDPGANPGPFLNSATAAGTSPAAAPVSDVSDDGTDPDPNGNGDPTETGENDPTPITFTETPVLGVA
ncbi:MAG: hypothetical protein GY718_19980, partial [Lentisphaerae bacterium]|nr:hypothetical protein [Lentisphaerota bacterium]